MVRNENKTTFLNFLNKKGKKGKIEKIYSGMLLNLKYYKQKNPQKIFNTVLTDLKPKLQIKKISRFKSTLRPLKKSRQTFTALQWLTEPSKQKNRLESITTEVFDTLYHKSQSYRKKILWYKDTQKLKYTLRRKRFTKQSTKLGSRHSK